MVLFFDEVLIEHNHTYSTEIQSTEHPYADILNYVVFTNIWEGFSQNPEEYKITCSKILILQILKDFQELHGPQKTNIPTNIFG